MPLPLDVIRSLYSAFASGDVPAVLAALSPDVHWTEAEGGPYGGTYVGPDAVLEGVFMKLGGEWESFSAIPSEFFTGEGAVVALGEYSATYRKTGKSFRAPFVHVWRLADDRVCAFAQHTDTVLHRRPMD